MDKIKGFNGEFRWLSNFYPATVIYNGITYPTVEHGYVINKTVTEFTEDDFKWFLSLHPGQVKKLGRQLTLRDDWEDVKVQIMTDLCKSKFSSLNPDLKQKLLDTGSCELIEENTWGDVFWGMTPKGIGQNILGKILMEIRGSTY